ncbi:hypothetical protein HHL23_09340 [Chryseobacterium sp. RP-3-3]|uniref:Uncharacterized protein n=1 Tax=Chryseobacterium antibioticum TaxID=2728847 RepID=A0A7Y0FRD0_9FLAO|nr:hypothetical protein [Chryseobacterium antibioticum]NML70003.1 hypothetical protein [Chryseobacterium antibioticum]
MKNETIWNLEDMLSIYENEKLDLEIDSKNTELKGMRDQILKKIKFKAVKIKELKRCIKWIKNQN